MRCSRVRGAPAGIKKAVESHRLLVETYGEHAPSIRTYETWFRQFKSGDFNVKDSECSGRPQKCEDEQLQELLDDDPTQTQRQLAEALHHKKQSADVYEQWERSINSVNGSHTI
ncbi:hypothetical protein P5V15_014091 [Pogonomyrmex californicus]